MSRFFIVLLSLQFFFCVNSRYCNADAFEMQAVVYPPLVELRGNSLGGVAVDVVREIQKMVGDDSRLSVMPWLRAYQKAQTEPNQVLFAIVRIPEREDLFKWVGPIFGEGDYFFKRKSSPLRISCLDDAKNVSRIAVRKDGYTHQTLLAKGFNNLEVGPTYDSSYRKLREGRVDLVLMGELTHYFMVRNAGLDPDDFERTDYRFAESSAWLAFSRDVPDEVIQKWQGALDELKENGRYEAIMDENFKAD